VLLLRLAFCRLFSRIFYYLDERHHFCFRRLKNTLPLFIGIMRVDKFPDGQSREPAVKDFAAWQSFIHGSAIMEGKNMPQHAAIPFFFIILISHVSSFGKGFAPLASGRARFPGAQPCATSRGFPCRKAAEGYFHATAIRSARQLANLAATAPIFSNKRRLPQRHIKHHHDREAGQGGHGDDINILVIAL